MDIKEIIGQNIQKLRLKSKMTQFELAEKLNYSDKTISKWERGESSPEPETMLELSKLFNVKIDYFYYAEHQTQYVNPSNKIRVKDLLFTILMSVTFFTVSTAAFLLGCFIDKGNASTFWIAFVYAVPITSIGVCIYFHRLNNRLGMIISSSVTMWSILAAIFLQMMLVHVNFWMIFLIGIPFQAALIIYRFMKN